MAIFGDRKLVLFDFDGVLVDSLGLNIDLNFEIYNQRLEHDQYRRLFMGNIFESLKRDYQTAGKEENIRAYSQTYGQRLQALSPILGVDRLLKKVAGGRAAYVVTSSDGDYVRRFLEKHQLADYFNGVHGQEVHYSKHVKFQNILAAEALQPKDAVFVTDTVGDILEAQAASIDTIAVTWGFHPRSWIDSAPHHSLVDTIDELMGLF